MTTTEAPHQHPPRRGRTRMAAVAAIAAIGALGMGAAGATAAQPPTAPPTGFQLTPSALNFGAVPIGSESIKPVTMTNRTKEWIDYGYPNVDNHWPNFGNPPGYDYPDGFWNRSWDPFPCYEIAPKSSCVLYFGFRAKEVGPLSSYFEVNYTGRDSGGRYTGTTTMRAVGVVPPPPA